MIVRIGPGGDRPLEFAAPPSKSMGHRAVLAAGHNDNISAPGRMDEGWGWLLDHGFNMIQTDWPMMLRHYMEHRK